MKLFVLTDDLEIGVISHVCNCEQCKERGNVELTINHLDGSFMLQTTIQNVLSKDDVIAVSDNINELRDMKSTMQYSDLYLCRLLEKKLLAVDVPTYPFIKTGSEKK